MARNACGSSRRERSKSAPSSRTNSLPRPLPPSGPPRRRRRKSRARTSFRMVCTCHSANPPARRPYRHRNPRPRRRCRSPFAAVPRRRRSPRPSKRSRSRKRSRTGGVPEDPVWRSENRWFQPVADRPDDYWHPTDKEQQERYWASAQKRHLAAIANDPWIAAIVADAERQRQPAVDPLLAAIQQKYPQATVTHVRTS